ncbi:hypothetical protein V8E55_008501, partial [Tylopilus felleus]
EELFMANGRTLLLNTVSLLAQQLITCVQEIHSHNYMYLNFKPNNILIGLALSTLLPNPPFLFDFSHSQLYRNPQIFFHVSFEHRGKTPLDSASVAFSLINYHLGNQH